VRAYEATGLTPEEGGGVIKRLTKRDNDGQAMMDCEKCKADWTGKNGKPMVDCTALYCRNRLKDRLAAYEDKGCAPEEVLPKDKADEIALKLMRLADLESLCSYTRLRELAEADKDGRLVVLPSDKALTNADRIRAATNQQLAKLLYDNQKEFCRIMYKNLGFEDELNFSEDYSDILAWLNAPSKEAKRHWRR
jgi:hypothetical protein